CSHCPANELESSDSPPSRREKEHSSKFIRPCARAFAAIPLLYRIRPSVVMTFRLSLRKKLVYTLLGGSLLTVVLFSLVIKEIMNDYFQRLAEVRLQYVS